MRASEAKKKVWAALADLYVVETQKTRKGEKKKTKAATRPYRFGEFDLLAVAMYPSTKRWDTFLFTVADWLLPAAVGSGEILKLQPVAAVPNDDWTDDIGTAIGWLRSGEKKTIRG